MASFYLCSELSCNRKYKTKEGLEKHLVGFHNTLPTVLGEPVLITKETKKLEENKKDDRVRKEMHLQKIKEIQRQKDLEEEARIQAEEAYKKEQIEQYRMLEQKKMALEVERVEYDRKFMSLLNKVQRNLNLQNKDLCSICFENKSDTAVITCGHKLFCYGCINDYHSQYPHKGCPICRKEIIMINKIYE